MRAPALTMFAEGRLGAAGPCRGRGAVLREFPSPPPKGEQASLGAALREA